MLIAVYEGPWDTHQALLTLKFWTWYLKLALLVYVLTDPVYILEWVLTFQLHFIAI